MTTQAFLGNGFGLALASDSTMTTRGRTYEDCEKLIVLKSPHQVVVAISGAVSQFCLPIGVVLKEWHASLGEVQLRTIADYRRNFVEWARASLNDLPRNDDGRADAYFGWARWELQEFLDSARESTSDLAPTDAGAWMKDELVRLNELAAQWERVDNFSELGGSGRARSIMTELWKPRGDVWEGLEAQMERTLDFVDGESADEIKELWFNYWVQQIEAFRGLGPITTLVFAGFGSKQILPHLAKLDLAGSYESWLAASSMGEFEPSPLGDRWFVIWTEGDDSRIQATLRGYRLDMINEVLVDSERENPEFQNRIRERVAEFEEDRNLQPLRNAVSSMPLATLAETCRTLVGVEVLGKTVFGEKQTTGGEIEVFTITKAEGTLRHVATP